MNTVDNSDRLIKKFHLQGKEEELPAVRKFINDNFSTNRQFIESITIDQISNTFWEVSLLYAPKYGPDSTVFLENVLDRLDMSSTDMYCTDYLQWPIDYACKQLDITEEQLAAKLAISYYVFGNVFFYYLMEDANEDMVKLVKKESLKIVDQVINLEKAYAICKQFCEQYADYNREIAFKLTDDLIEDRGLNSKLHWARGILNS